MVSYGALVFLDYIRYYGEDHIGGLQFVSTATNLGSEQAKSVLTPEFLSVVSQCLSTDAETSVQGLEGLLRLCFARKPSAPELYLMLGYNVTVPPYVRQGLFARSFHNDDLLRQCERGRDVHTRLVRPGKHVAVESQSACATGSVVNAQGTAVVIIAVIQATPAAMEPAVVQGRPAAMVPVVLQDTFVAAVSVWI